MFRHSQGRVPAVPSLEVLVQQLGHEGPMGRTVADVALLLATQAGPDERAPLSLDQDPSVFAEPLRHDMKGARVGWLGDLGGYLPMEPGVLDLCRGNGLKALETVGCAVEEAALGYPPERMWQTWLVWRHWLVGGGLSAFADDPAKAARMKPEALWEVEGGRKLSAFDVYRASQARTALHRAVLRLFEAHDYLALPTAQVFPFAAEVHWPKEIAGRAMDTYHRWMEVTILATLAGWLPDDQPARRLQRGRLADGHAGDRPAPCRPRRPPARPRLRAGGPLGGGAPAAGVAGGLIGTGRSRRPVRMPALPGRFGDPAMLRRLCALLTLLAPPAALAGALPAAGEQPLVIAHRGASGYRPEHTLAAYALAIDMGADCVEPDLVMTRDGALVARHEPEIGLTTDAPTKFPDRKTRKSVDGEELEGWFAEDFTLAELKTLRVRQPRDDRASAWDGLHEVPTLQEVIELARREGAERGREVCLYPETKHPTYLAERGLDIDAALARALAEAGLSGPDAPVFVQSFEPTNLKRLAGMTGVRLVQLLDEAGAQPYDLAKAGDPRTYGDLMTPEGLREIASYAAGIGPWKRSVVAEDAAGRSGRESALVRDAHAAGLLVHPYTFRDEPRHLAEGYGGDPQAEYLEFFRLGVDGVFSDFPDTALRARARLAGGG